MYPILFWTFTVQLSILMNATGMAYIFDCMHYNGYKFKSNSRVFYSSGTKYFIPVFNILYGLRDLNNSVQNKDNIVRLNYDNNKLEKLKNYEIRYYKKNPSLLTSLCMEEFISPKLIGFKKIEFCTENEKSRIFYKLDKNNNMTILTCSGPFRKLSEEEIKNNIRSALKLDLPKENKTTSSNSDNLENNKTSINNKNNDIENKKRILKSYRQELLNKKYSSKDSHNKIYKLTKKK